MRKFQKTPLLEAPKVVPVCADCGWDFSIPHLTTIVRAGTTKSRNDTRVKISHGGGYMCDECYGKLLIRQHRHPYSDITQQDMDAWGKTATLIARCIPFLGKFLREAA